MGPQHAKRARAPALQTWINCIYASFFMPMVALSVLMPDSNREEIAVPYVNRCGSVMQSQPTHVSEGHVKSLD